MLLQDLKRKTDEVFSGSRPLVSSAASTREQDELDALLSCGLRRQHAARLFELRVANAQNIGFQRVEVPDMVERLMGNKPSCNWTGDHQNFEWLFNHHVNEVYAPGAWGGRVTNYVSYKPQSFLQKCFDKLERDWTCILGKLDYLRRSVPYGVALRIAELKESRTFNGFMVLAPEKAWMQRADVDPLVLGFMAEFPPDDNGLYRTCGEQAFFFVAQW